MTAETSVGNSEYSVRRSYSSPASIICATQSEMRMAKTATTEHKIEDFEEDLGKMLGHARNKAEGWLGLREQIVKNLTQVRDAATKLLSQLGHDAAVVGSQGRTMVNKSVAGIRRGPGRPAGSTNSAIGGKKRRKM